jgi:hypothetical protein
VRVVVIVLLPRTVGKEHKILLQLRLDGVDLHRRHVLGEDIERDNDVGEDGKGEGDADVVRVREMGRNGVVLGFLDVRVLVGLSGESDHALRVRKDESGGVHRGVSLGWGVLG